MLRITAYNFLLLSVGSVLAVSAGAQPVVDDEGAALPPPPGPYISSRPQLTLNALPQRNSNRMPFMGNMPSMPMSMPMRGMPVPNQFPAPSPWWRGPVGY